MEYKCKDTYWQGGVLTTGSWQCCNHLSQGYTARTRIGNQICMKRIEYRAEVSWQDAHAITSTSRVIILLDRQANGSTPVLGEMFLTTGVSYTAFVQPLNWDYGDRFFILYDKSISTSSDYGGAAVGNDPRALIEFSADVNIPVAYAGNAGTAADIITNTLWCFWIGNVTSGSVNAAEVNNWCRVIYTDS